MAKINQASLDFLNNEEDPSQDSYDFLNSDDDTDASQSNLSFLGGDPGIKKSSPSLIADEPRPADVPRPADAPSAFEKPATEEAGLAAFGTLTQASQATVGEFVDLLGLPGDASNWIMQKFGSDMRFQTGESLRDIGADAGITTRKGEAADTAMTKVGQTIGMGLEFVAPFLALGKAATLAKATSGTVASKSGVAVDLEAVPWTRAGKLKDMASSMATPFLTSPKLAATSEVAGGFLGGVGAYYGGKEYGAKGAVIGGLLGGIGGQVSPALMAVGGRQAVNKLFPMTVRGGRIKSAGRIQELAETRAEDVLGTIANESKKVLPGAKISPARLSGDKHLIAMEKELIKNDSALVHEFETKRAAVNDLARAEMQKLGGDTPIEETQAYFKWRTDHIKSLIDKKVDLSLTKAKATLEPLSPIATRTISNKLVEKQVQDALTKSRNIETEMWSKVDRTIPTTTSDSVEGLRKILASRESSADKKQIEPFLEEFLGRYDKDGLWVTGKFKPSETVGQLTTFRSRVTTAMREEAGKESPDWNKHRILDDIQEAVLKDLKKVDGDSNYSAAVDVSRKLNEKFKSETLLTILGHQKTGGKLAPELTLESINEGMKAGVKAKEIIAASPKSMPIIEDFLKSKIANSLIDKMTGRLKARQAKAYVDNNEMLMDMFPDLKRSLEHAIGQEERSIGMKLKGKAAEKKLLGSSVAKIGGMKPGRVLSEILNGSNPQMLMRKMMQQSNAKGISGVKNDIMDYLLKKSRTGKINDNNNPVHSGRKMAVEWKATRKVFSEALTQSESERVELIINTLTKVESLDLPKIGDVIAPSKGLAVFVTKFLGAQSGARLGKLVGPGTIQVPHYFAKLAEERFGRLDTGMARKLLVDAVQDQKLFESLLLSTTTRAEEKKIIKVLHGWLLAQTVQSLEAVGE